MAAGSQRHPLCRHGLIKRGIASMLDKYTSEASNYNSRKTSSKKRAMVYFVTAIVSSVALLFAGCSAYQQGGDEPNKETPYAPKITSSPTSSGTPAPTAEPTATPEPTPEPTPTPEPLTIEEKIAKFELFDGYGNGAIPLNQLRYVDYIINGENKITLTLLCDGLDERDGKIKLMFINMPDAYPLFAVDLDIFETYGLGDDAFQYYELYADGYYGGSLEVLDDGGIHNFESMLASKGIVVPKTKFSDKINDPSAKGYMRAADIVEYLATVLPDSYCVFHEDLIGNNAEATPAPTK